MLINVELKVGERVDKFLSEYLEISRSKISKSIIKVNDKVVKPSYKLNKDDKLEIYIEQKQELEIEAKDIELDVVYEDEYIAVINKAYDMVVHPSNTHKENTLVNALLYKYSSLSNINKEGAGIVHRLDKDTSGLIIIAKNNEVHEKLALMFKNHEIEKTYIALLNGKFNKTKLRYETYIGRSIKDRKQMSSNTNKGKLAISIFELLDNNEKYSLVKVNILTGRTHQIRVHAKELGHSLVGDAVYGKKNDKVKRQQLHSYRLRFIHPISLEPMDIKTDIAEDMLENIKKCKLEVDYARI